MDVNPFSSADSSRQAPAATPSGPPPPYESILEAGPGSDSIGTGSYPSSSAPWAEGGSTAGVSGRPKEFEIAVADPVKQGDGVSAYVSYKVRTHTTLPQYARQDNEVIRRFRDFAWLAERLAEGHKGCIVPPLPEKSAVQKWQMQADFIEERRRALQVFVNRVAAHPVLKSSKELQSFLEATEDEWALEMARVQVQTGGAKKRLDNAVGWFKGIGTATTNLVQGKGTEATEDPEYIKVRDYIGHLEAHLSEAHRQACRLIRKEGELAEAVAEFGASIEKLGRLEEGNVQEALLQLSNKATVLAEAGKARTAAVDTSFEAPLKEAVRYAKAVGAVCADRAAALATVSAAKHDLDVKKVRWSKLRGTPGSLQDKLAEAERDVNEADGRVRGATIAYDEVVSRMTEELNRYQKERAAEMDALLRDFAVIQAQLAADGVKAWSALLAELQAITSA